MNWVHEPMWPLTKMADTSPSPPTAKTISNIPDTLPSCAGDVFWRQNLRRPYIHRPAAVNHDSISCFYIIISATQTKPIRTIKTWTYISVIRTALHKVTEPFCKHLFDVDFEVLVWPICKHEGRVYVLNCSQPLGGKWEILPYFFGWRSWAISLSMLGKDFKGHFHIHRRE